MDFGGRILRGAASLAAVTAALLAGSVAADAAPRQKTGAWGQLTAQSAQVAPGFPSGTVSSDAPQFASAQSATMNAATPPGQIYGTSAGSSYLSVRPLTTTAPFAPSTTTITFSSPTPSAFWSFVFGDVDAESVTISASGPGGATVPASDLGFRGTYNSTGVVTDTDQPQWDASTATLAGNGPDTNGASAWFSPTVPVVSLTFTSTRLTGNPTLQFWLTGLTSSLSGRVVDTGGAAVPNAGVTVEQQSGLALPGPAASVVAGPDGAFDLSVFPTTEPLRLVVTPSDRPPPAPLIVTATPDADGVPVFDAVTVTTAALAGASVNPTTGRAAGLAESGVLASPWWTLGAIGLVLVGAVMIRLGRVRIPRQ